MRGDSPYARHARHENNPDESGLLKVKRGFTSSAVGIHPFAFGIELDRTDVDKRPYRAHILGSMTQHFDRHNRQVNLFAAFDQRGDMASIASRVL